MQVVRKPAANAHLRPLTLLLCILLAPALHGTVQFLWHLPGLLLGTSHVSAALSLLATQTWFAKRMAWLDHLLLWPAAWALLTCPWSSFTAAVAVWILFVQHVLLLLASPGMLLCSQTRKAHQAQAMADQRLSK